MNANVVDTASRGFSIRPVKRVYMNTREPRQESYAAKKKSGRLFSEILSGEIASISASDSNESNGNSAQTAKTAMTIRY